jgi:Tfp pilus assembly protein PilF
VGYRALLERWPNNTNGAVGLANTNHALGELAEAERVLREAAKRDPASVVVLNNWAMTLSDLGRNDEALPVIERAAKLGGPFAGAVEKTRATILGRQGRGIERVQ